MPLALAQVWDFIEGKELSSRLVYKDAGIELPEVEEEVKDGEDAHMDSEVPNAKLPPAVKDVKIAAIDGHLVVTAVINK